MDTANRRTQLHHDVADKMLLFKKFCITIDKDLFAPAWKLSCQRASPSDFKSRSTQETDLQLPWNLSLLSSK